MHSFSQVIIKYRKIIIVSTIALILLFGYFAKNIKINPNITTYMPKTDPVVKTFNHIGIEYGGNFLAIVMIEADNIFDTTVISKISLLTEQFKLVNGVSDVTSLANIIDIKKSEDGIEVGKLIDEFNPLNSGQDLENLKDYVLSKEMYNGHIISSDAKTSLIICRLGEEVDQLKTVRQIKDITGQAGIQGKTYFAGVPFQVMEINNIINSDLKLLIPIIGLIISLLLFLSFRSFAGIALPLSAVFTSIVLTLGIMSICKIPLTIISNIIPVILVTVGSAYSIHIINSFYENKTSPNRAAAALKSVGIPVMLAALTTIAGFVSFAFNSYLTMIKDFGIFTSIGVFLAFLVSITFVPSVLAMMPNRYPTRVRYNKVRSGNTNKPANIAQPQKEHNPIVNKIALLVMKNAKWLLIFSIIVAITSVVGIPKISRVSDMLDYFKLNSQIRISEKIMQNKFGGSVPIQILVKGDIQSPAVLSKMKNIEDFLAREPCVNNPQSIADLIEEMSYVIGEGKNIPDSRDKVTNLWFLLEGEPMISQMVNADKTEALLQAMVSGVETAQGKQMLKNIQAYINTIDTTDCKFEMTGSPLIYDHLDKSLMKSQVQSLIIALLLVFVMLAILLRSFSGGLVGMVPIIFTLLVIFGFMGYAGIPLDVATVLVGSVSIGIGIDYSIHFINRCRQEIKNNPDKRRALTNTIQTSGRAILINVIIVTAGFLVLIFANLIPLQRFGILVAITMVSSGLSAITILPSIILLSKHKLINNK